MVLIQCLEKQKNRQMHSLSLAKVPLSQLRRLLQLLKKISQREKLWVKLTQRKHVRA